MRSAAQGGRQAGRHRQLIVLAYVLANSALRGMGATRDEITMRLSTVTLIAILALGMLCTPPAARAQQAGKVYRIGVLERTSMALNAANLGAFRQGMRELGYVEGQNLVIEYRYAQD